MLETIRVAILDDHPAIVEGYVSRIAKEPGFEVAVTMHYGYELEVSLEDHPVDVLLLDVNVPNSADDSNPFPIMFMVPRLLQLYPNLAILVISMHAQKTLIKAIMEAGASGYLLKDDIPAFNEMPAIIRTVAAGGIYLSQQAYLQLSKYQPEEPNHLLTARQAEVISLCAAYPDATTAEISKATNVANSTVRNLLSSAYIRLGVHTRAAAVAKARKLGLITPDIPPLHVYTPNDRPEL